MAALQCRIASLQCKPMKLHLHLFAIILAGFMSFAHAEPESGAGNKPNLGIFADPIAQFAAPGEEAVGDLLLQAMSLMGVAYRFGGSSPETGLDCSGFIQYVFRKSLRVNLPRTSAEMARVGRVIDRDELAPGDLVFYNTRGFQYSHVGLYLGGNKFIHSPRTGKSVEVANMSNSYWSQRFNGARRVNRGGSEWKEPVTARATNDRSSADRSPAEKKVAGKTAVEKKPASKKVADKPAAEKKGKSSTRAERRKAAREQEARKQTTERKSSSRKKSEQTTRKKKKPD